MSETITSGADFKSVLDDAVARYLQHFEPTANPELFSVRLEASGPQFNLSFVKSQDATPYMQFTLQTDHPGQPAPESRGFFGTGRG